MYIILHKTKSKAEQKQICEICIENSISYEYLNGNECYFAIYSDNDLERLQKHLGESVINKKNII